MLRGALRAAVLLFFAALAAAPAHPQRLAGRVLLGEEGVGGVPVTLHRVTRDSSGAVGTARSAPDGSFTLDLPPADTSAGFNVFFATAEFRGVRYFGPPLHSGDAGTPYAVQVFDTASASRMPGAVKVVRRDVIVLPEGDGGAEVNEIVRLRNTGDRALVLGSGASTWELRLPARVAAFEVGEGQIAPDAVVRMGDRVLVTATLPPGEQDLFFRYRLPRGTERVELPVAARTDTMNLFLRTSEARSGVSGLAAGAEVEVDGERFLRYTGAGLDAKTAVVMEWDHPDAPPVDPRLAAVAVTGVVLTAGAGLAFRRGRRRPA
ncbi:MAG TPA: hypothetical protein VGR37_10375 [Longimicrobiaceae bacterium]|nr:hypothetical protein [Longimicrobiaceae bacterium]